MNLKSALIGLSALAIAGAAQAGTNILTNADFSSNANPGAWNRDAGVGPTGVATGWTVYGFGNGGIIGVVAASTLNNASGTFTEGYSLWNANNGGLNTITPPPNGATWVLDQDSASVNAAYITQMMTGLTVGQTYSVSFDWAGAQLAGWDGVTNDQWLINEGGTYSSFGVFTGGTTESTPVIDVADKGFTGWESFSTTFVATATSEAFNLEAVSSAADYPPFALMANLDVSAVPEPSTWVMIFLGVAGLGAAARWRRHSALVAA